MPCADDCREVALEDGTPCCTCTLAKFKALYGYDYPGAVLQPNSTVERP